MFFASDVSRSARLVMSAEPTQLPGAAAPASARVLSGAGCFRSALHMWSGKSERWAGRRAGSLYMISSLLESPRPAVAKLPQSYCSHSPGGKDPVAPHSASRTARAWGPSRGRKENSLHAIPPYLWVLFSPQCPQKAPVCTLCRLASCSL